MNDVITMNTEKKVKICRIAFGIFGILGSIYYFIQSASLFFPMNYFLDSSMLQITANCALRLVSYILFTVFVWSYRKKSFALLAGSLFVYVVGYFIKVSEEMLFYIMATDLHDFDFTNAIALLKVILFIAILVIYILIAINAIKAFKKPLVSKVLSVVALILFLFYFITSVVFNQILTQSLNVIYSIIRCTRAFVIELIYPVLILLFLFICIKRSAQSNLNAEKAITRE